MLGGQPHGGGADALGVSRDRLRLRGRRAGAVGAVLATLATTSLFVLSSPATAATACSAPAASPALNGSFIDPDAETQWTAQDTTSAAANLCNAGITDVVLQQTSDADTNAVNFPAPASGPFATFSYTGSDAVGNWFAALALHPGMHLYIGLDLSTAEWWDAASNPQLTSYLDTKAGRDISLADTVYDQYRNRPEWGSEFAGWYLPDEIAASSYASGTTALPQATTLAAHLLAPVTAALHSLTPGAAVFTSPFYNAATTAPGAWTDLWTTILDVSVQTAGITGAVDAIAPQDGLGHSGGQATAADLDTWFSALAAGINASAARGQTAVWDNVETYRLDGTQYSHYATEQDMVTAMRAAAAHTPIAKYLSFSYAEDQARYAPLDTGYRLYVTGQPDATRPGAPTQLTVRRVDRATVRLTWTKHTDTGGSGLFGYRIFRDGRIAAEVDDATISAFTDNDLLPGQHSWYVVALDGAGNQSVPSGKVSSTITAPRTNLALNARYWFPSTLPSGGYHDGCVANSFSGRCAGQLTNGEQGTYGTLSTVYPQMFAGYDGIVGDFEIDLDLGLSRTIHEVDTQWVSYINMGVWLPSTVTVYTSTNATDWTALGTGTSPNRPANAGIWPNYVPDELQNFAALYPVIQSRTARYVRVVGVNPYGTDDWTMLHSVLVS